MNYWLAAFLFLNGIAKFLFKTFLADKFLATGKNVRSLDSNFVKFEKNLNSNFKDLASFYEKMVEKPTDTFKSGLLSDDMLKRNFLNSRLYRLVNKV